MGDLRNEQAAHVEMLREKVITAMTLVKINAERTIKFAKENQVINSLGELQMTAHSADIACAQFAEAKRALDLMESNHET